MFPEVLESERLRFGRLSRERVDVLELYDLFGRNPDAEELLEYVDFGPHRTVKETYDFVRRAEQEWEDGEGAKYVVRVVGSGDRDESEDRDGSGDPDGTMAGFTGIYPDWERRFATLGIVLDKAHWGRGYSAERAELFVELAFERLDLELVAVKYIDGNAKSKRAVEKYVETFGGQYDGRLRNWIAVDGDVVDCHRYSIRRDQYEASRD